MKKMMKEDEQTEDEGEDLEDEDGEVNSSGYPDEE